MYYVDDCVVAYFFMFAHPSGHVQVLIIVEQAIDRTKRAIKRVLLLIREFYACFNLQL
jgi:hypothetical protein